MECKFFLGTALDTLLDDGNIQSLRVHVHELMPFAKGDPGELFELDVDVNNLAPDSKKIDNVKFSSYIVCNYLGIQANLIRPSIHIGEQVAVMSIDNDSRFYWFELGRDYHTRMTELHRIFVANKDNQKDDLNEDNAYLIECDTRKGNKSIHIKTNMNMGEPFSYDIKIDTTNGMLHVTDNDGNLINLNSTTKTWNIKNSNGDEQIIEPGKITNNTSEYVVNASTITLNGDTTITGNMDTIGSGRIEGKLPHGDIEAHSH